MEHLLCYVRLWVVVMGASTALWPEVSMATDGVVINEFQIHGPSQYVELYDGGVGRTQLDGLTLVLYSGASEAVYAQPLGLDGILTGPTGYCLVSFGPPSPGAELNSSAVLRSSSGLNAVAVYDQSGGGSIQTGSAVTDVNLVDAVVYGHSPDPQGSRLVSVLSKGQYPLQKSGPPGSHHSASLGRCRGWRGVMHSSFREGVPTPGSDNDCALPAFVLNEVNPTIGETWPQFIEIFDGGLGFLSTDGIMAVVYVGNRLGDSVKTSVDLTGYTTDSRGFLVVAANGTGLGDVAVPALGMIPGKILPTNKPAGVALHLGAPKRFAEGTPLTDYNLIDAIVYQLDKTLPVDAALLSFLAPGHTTVFAESADYSISRCYCCAPRNLSAFGQGPPSPGDVNRLCSVANRSVVQEAPARVVRINEVHFGGGAQSSTEGDFVELFDEGFGQTALAGKMLVLFAGTEEGGMSYRAVDLLNSVTNSEGYFVIAPSNFPDLAADWLLRDDALEPSGAVALFERAAGFTLGSGLTADGLLDALVFGNKSSMMTSRLLDGLLPGQALAYTFLPDTDSSILRCYSLHPLDQAAFVAGPPSPLALNVCPPPPCRINELNSLASSSSGIFVEISCGGIPNLSLATVIGVMWNFDITIAVPLVRFRTNNDGFASSNFKRIGRVRGAFAVALYFAPNATDLLNEETRHVRLTDTGLLDAVVVEKDNNQDSVDDWLRVLTPGRPPLREHEAFSHRDESLSLCPVGGKWVFVLAHVSRDGHNHCPTRDNPEVIINEVNLPERDQFVELFDLGSGFTILDEFVVVLFSEAGRAVQVLSLAGYSTDANGYFLLGVQGDKDWSDLYYAFAEGLIDPNSGGVALYRSGGDGSTLLVGDMITTDGLVDTIIYTNEANFGPALYPLMADGSSVALNSGDQHFSRCLSGELRSSLAFSSDRPPTPAGMNDCPVYPSDVVINEMNFAEHGPTPEAFVELYDGGRGSTPLTYLTLVAFAAVDNNGAYRAVDLSGYQTNEQGYFTIGAQDADLVITLERTYGGNTQPHGAGAIALYRAHPGVFYHAAAATKTSLVDALVYTLDIDEETTLVDDLLPIGSFLLYEDETLEEEDGMDEGFSRCFDSNRLTQSAFRLAERTPSGPNACGPKTPTRDGIFISEVNVKSPPGLGFVELFDGGQGMTSLDGYLLVLYQASRDRSYYEVDLAGKQTGSSGYLVIGGAGVTPTPGVVLNDLSFLGGVGAVAIYRGSVDLFPRGTLATPRSLVDVVVYGDPLDRADGLVARLVPGQIQAYENGESADGGQDVSLSRCVSMSALNIAAFVTTLKTPGAANNCDALYKPVYINEIGPHGAPTERYIELYSDRGHTSLDAIVLLLLEEGFNTPYDVIPLTGNRTDGDGYYLISRVSQLRASGQVALYRGDHTAFGPGRDPVGTLVDRQSYSTIHVDATLLEGSPTSERQTFTRCPSCQSSGGSYLTLAPLTPGIQNRCPVSAYGSKVTVTLTEARFDVWQYDQRLVPALERALAQGVNSRCRCGFTVDYLCDPKLLKGSVIYQASMYATSHDQSRRLTQSLQAFLADTGTITLHGKAYTVAGEGTAPPKGDNGSSPLGAIVVPVVLAVVVLVVVIVAAGCFIKKRKLASQFDDNVKLEERNANEFENITVMTAGN